MNKEKIRDLFISDLQRNNSTYTSLIKPIINKIMEIRSKRWVDVVDEKTKQETIDILNLTKELKPDKSVYIDKILDNLDSYTFVYDKNNQWNYLNKLNTNWSDYPIFIVDLLIDSENFNIYEIYEDNIHKNFTKFQEFLNVLPNHAEFIWDNFLIDEERYTSNIKKNSKDGEYIESLIESFYIKEGWEIVHKGGNGDIIDMTLSTDLIVKKGTTYQYVQVKSARSINVINHKNKEYIEVCGNAYINNKIVIDVVGFGTSDGQIFISKPITYNVLNGDSMKKHSGFPIPDRSNGGSVLIPNNQLMLTFNNLISN